LKDREGSSSCPHILVTCLLHVVTPTANIGHSRNAAPAAISTTNNTALNARCIAVAVDATGTVRTNTCTASCVAAIHATAFATRCSAVVTITVTGTAKPCSGVAGPVSTTVRATNAVSATVSATNAVAGIPERWWCTAAEDHVGSE